MNNVQVSDNGSNHEIVKSRFKFKQHTNGIILTVHHTKNERNAVIRVRFVKSCFSENNIYFVGVDHRGNIFSFDLVSNKFWKSLEIVPKCHTIQSFPNRPSEFVIGTKDGKLIIVDILTGYIKKSKIFSQQPIEGISFSSVSSVNCLLFTNREAILINPITLEQTHRLEYNENKISIKFVSFIPKIDKIFACFSNDSVHIWSGSTLNTNRILHPIRMREKYLKSNKLNELQISNNQNENELDLLCKTITKDFTRGLLSSISLSLDGNYMCLPTIDDYIIIMTTISYDIINVIKLNDNSCKTTYFLPQSEKMMLFILTSTFDTILIDCNELNTKYTVQHGKSYKMNISNNGKMLAIILKTGEINLYKTSVLVNSIRATQTNLNIVKDVQQKKNMKIDIISDELRNTLSKTRLIPILKEYGEYPAKYRHLIWSSLLELPCNKQQFIALFKRGNHPNVSNYDQEYPLKDISALRNLKKIMSCLIHWCKLFGHCDYLPGFVFPFLEVFPNNSLITFEIIVTILLNHCQLWFEFAPLEPLNYLGIIENALSEFDPELASFYRAKQITAKIYAWSMLSTSFSEVLDKRQWYQLWDNIISNPPYFLVFCIIAYNIHQRNVIMRLESKETIETFFHDQNIIDMKKFINRATILMEKCPKMLHPNRYMKKFEKIPKNFYPKFENYPQEWIELKDNEMETLRIEREILDKKIRELEIAEKSLAERLEEGLKHEEHQKRMKEVEKLYGEALSREEQRIACQRKMLLIYQKEIRDRKGKVLNIVRDSAFRKNMNLRENELDSLMRSFERSRIREETDMLFADENIKNEEINLLAEKYQLETQLFDSEPFQTRFKTAIGKLEDEKEKLAIELKNLGEKKSYKKDNTQRNKVANKISTIDDMLDQIQMDFIRTIEYNFDNDISKGDKLKKLDKTISCLETEAQILLNQLK